MAQQTNSHYKALDMETFHGLERFRSALDDYKESNPDKPDSSDLRKDPTALSAVYSKAFGIEDKFASLEGDYKSAYQDRLVQAASNAYALNEPNKAYEPENRRDAFADFSYDSPHSSKNVEMVFEGSVYPNLDGVGRTASVKLNNATVPIKDAELGRGQKNDTLYYTNDMHFGGDDAKLHTIRGAKPEDFHDYDDRDGYKETAVAFKADVVPLVRLSDDSKTINLVGFAPDMSTLKKTDCTYSVNEILDKSADVSLTLYKNANPLLRDGNCKNDMGMRAVQEGRDILSKMATMPSNEKAMPDMFKSYNKELDSKEAEKHTELATWYSGHKDDVTSWDDVHKLLEKDGDFSVQTRSGSPYKTSIFDKTSSVESITKEKAEGIINDIAAHNMSGSTFLSKEGKAYYENMQSEKAAAEKASDSSAKRYNADFSLKSGNSREDVEMIAVIKPNHEYYKTDANGEKKLAAVYVDTQVNNSKLSQADVAVGNGQRNSHLYNECKDGKFNSAVPWTPSQVDKLKETCGADAYTAKNGTMYIPLKADVMPMQRTVDGKPTTVGYMPNTKTIEKSDFGPLTKDDINKHFDNTKALSNAKFNKNTGISIEDGPNAEKNTQMGE